MDSKAAEGILLKGYSKSPQLAVIASLFWKTVRQGRASAWIDRVPTHLNVADAISRGCFSSALALQAEKLQAQTPVVSAWETLLGFLEGRTPARRLLEPQRLKPQRQTQTPQPRTGVKRTDRVCLSHVQLLLVLTFGSVFFLGMHILTRKLGQRFHAGKGACPTVSFGSQMFRSPAGRPPWRHGLHSSGRDQPRGVPPSEPRPARAALTSDPAGLKRRRLDAPTGSYMLLSAGLLPQGAALRGPCRLRKSSC